MFGVASRCEELRGKLMGYYVDYAQNINKNSMHDLSADQLEERMKQIIEEYKPMLEQSDEKR